MSEKGIADGRMILKTANGIYAVYQTRSGLVDGDATVNEFTLQQITGDASQELAYSYSYYGLQDLVADAKGNVYVIGGATNWNMNGLSGKYDVNAREEQTILNIWKYDAATGVLNGYNGYKNFTGGTGFTYLTSSVDTEAGKIYTAYVGTNEDNAPVVEYFTFDIATMTWEEESDVIVLTATAQQVFAFAGENGLDLVYGDASAVYAVIGGTETKVVDGLLRDAYIDGEGETHILYATTATDVATLRHLTLNATADTDTGIAAADLAKFAEANGELYIVSMDTENPVTVDLHKLSDNTVVTTKMDEAVVAQDVLMLARAENGSVDSSELAMMLCGFRGNALSWYYGPVTTE